MTSESPDQDALGYISVAVAIPSLPVLTYSVPSGSGLPPIGSRVLVPVGHREIVGCVVGTDVPYGSQNTSGLKKRASASIRPFIECYDDGPFLPLETLEVAQWTAEYFVCGYGEVIAAAMPPTALDARRLKQRRSGFREKRLVTITPKGVEAFRNGGKMGLGVRQLEALGELVKHSKGLFAEALGSESSVIGRLERRQLVMTELVRCDRDPLEVWGVPTETEATIEDTRPQTLTREQSLAVEKLTPLVQRQSFRAALLHGVTGSGKTEVYLRLAEEAVRNGRRVIVLVPEIALTLGIADSFARAFSGRVAVQHSGLSVGERHDQWHRIRSGDIDVVVGTRSAVFAPISDVGLIVVDEEHDASYKQEESPRYHAKSVALVRGQRLGALVVLGSATPAVETYRHAVSGRYEKISLLERVNERPLAQVEIVDMRREVVREGPDVIVSEPLRVRIGEVIGQGEQVLLLMNRRGFASGVLCRQCGQTLECPNCSVALTLHISSGRTRCHYCNYAANRPVRCPHCVSPYLEMIGFGTERVEQELRKHFPGTTLARLDRDTVRRRGELVRVLRRFRQNEIQIVVGTQMIAKGHDFPNVTLVGVISADVGLTVADFRASERTFQLLTQVAGRAGRGLKEGRAVVQSYYPEHYSITHACQQAYEPFFQREIAFRRDLNYPPHVSMINVIVKARTFSDAMNDALVIASEIRKGRTSFEVLGPAPPPIGRVRGQYRAQLFLKGNNRKAMREGLQRAVELQPAGVKRRISIDVDPVNMM